MSKNIIVLSLSGSYFESRYGRSTFSLLLSPGQLLIVILLFITYVTALVNNGLLFN